MAQTESEKLTAAGNDLARELRKLRDEHEQNGSQLSDDAGWLRISSALLHWKHATYPDPTDSTGRARWVDEQPH